MTSSYAPRPGRHRQAPGWFGRITDLFSALWRPGRTARSAAEGPAGMTKQEAIARAIAAVPHRDSGMRTWVSVDATMLRGLWLCLLEDEWSVFVVCVSTQTSQAHLAAEGPRRRQAPPRHGGRSVSRAFHCPQTRGCPPSTDWFEAQA
ncbi:hypothetical protein [Luedemannella helvata]|uniref:Transposase n=1 Tax=Luedemannella helvata TaxID=349315 RepID=A0ABP4XBW6_9ACTN